MIRRIEYQRTLRQQVQAALDALLSQEYTTINDYLMQTYTDAYIGTMYSLFEQDVPVIAPINQDKAIRATTIDSKLSEGLYMSLQVDTNRLRKEIVSQITRGIASGLSYTEIAQNIQQSAEVPFHRARTITITEGGRVQEQANFDAATEAKKQGADVVKQWSSVRDVSTRDTHRMLDGQVRELDEPFTVEGKEAMHPHGFGLPEEDINCRCTMLTRARAALDESDLKKMQDRAVMHGLYIKGKNRDGFYKAKFDSFDEFKERYLKTPKSKDNAPMTPEEQEVYLRNFLRDKKQTGTSKPVTIGGMDVTVTKAVFGFSDGRGGAKKTVDAVIYETKDGTKFVFPKSYNKANQQMTPEKAIALWAQVPSDIRRQSQKLIQFVDYYNPQDIQWQKIYKNFKHSYASGGSTITFYRYDYPHNDAYVVRTYCHEAGHFIDYNNGTNGNFSSEALWTKAMIDNIITSGRKSCTAYGENSAAEDFAESVAEYVETKSDFDRFFPNRAAILANIISIRKVK